MSAIKLTRPLVFFDLETTGLNPNKDRIVEIYAEPLGDPDRALNTLVNPGVPIPAVTSKTHKIYDADVKDAPTMAELADDLLDLFTGCDLAGYNIGTFDIPFLQAEFNRAGIKVNLSGAKVIDCFTIFRKMESKKTLDAAFEFYTCNARLEGTHQAAEDVDDTVAVFEAQVKKYKLSGSVEDMLTQLKESGKAGGGTPKIKELKGEFIFQFGKHKGKSIGLLAMVDSDYLEWCIREGVAAPWKEDMQRAILKAREKAGKRVNK